MKKVIIYVPIVLSLVVLGAHFLRYGNSFGVIGAAILIGLLFVRKPWAVRLLQAALVLGTIEWVYTLYVMANLRVEFGQPYIRLVIILGVVAAVTFISALLFQLPTLRRIYRL